MSAKVFSLICIASVIVSACASQHAFVPRSMFNEQPISIGYGRSMLEAKRNSEKVIPPEFERETPTGLYGCANPKEFPAWNARIQDTECPSKTYYYISPLLPKDENERAELLAFRENQRGETIVGTGDTLTEAMTDVISKIPKDSVTDHYSVGCTKEISIDSQTGRSYCDRSISGNQSKIEVHLRKPNVNSYLNGK